MIPIPSGVRVCIATGHTDMRRGMQGLALTVQESLKRDPHAGDRLDRGKFIWPSASDGTVSISAAQMAYMLEGIDWRNPQLTWRPKSAG
jgi:transposase